MDTALSDALAATRAPVRADDGDKAALIMHAVLRDKDRQAIHDLAQKYPNSIAFADHEAADASLEQHLLEFKLENLITQSLDLVEARRASLTSRKKPPVLPSTAHSLRDLLHYRSERQRLIAGHLEVPRPPPVTVQSDIFLQQVRHAARPGNSPDVLHPLLAQFYASQRDVLVKKKEKVLLRWSRHSAATDRVEDLQRLVQDRLTSIDRDIDLVSARAKHLDGQAPELGDEADRAATFFKGTVEPADLRYYLRSWMHQNRSTRLLRRFTSKLQWLAFSQRYELWQQTQAFLQSNQETEETSSIPVLLTSADALHSALEDLKQYFELMANIERNEGLEFYYQANKKFNQLFADQVDAMQFLSYDASETAPAASASDSPDAGDDDGPAPASDKGPAADAESQAIAFGELRRQHLRQQAEARPLGPDAEREPTFKKASAWLPLVTYTPSLSDIQLRQIARLEQVKRVNQNLRVEAGFLANDDPAFVIRRLKELVESHATRAAIAERTNAVASAAAATWANTDDPTDTGARPSTLSAHQLLSLYMLRHLRSRDYRRKILGSLNYCRAIERRLTMSSSHEHDAAHVLPSREVRVRDSEGNFVVYDCALQDLERLELELVQLGTHYLTRAVAGTGHVAGTGGLVGNEAFDPMALLADLLESEHWYQDAKRRVLDAYLEIYDHTYDPAALARISQSILDLLPARPRLDFDAPYFSEAYASEIVCLEFKLNLLREFIASQSAIERKAVSAHQVDRARAHPWQLEGLPDPVSVGRPLTLVPDSSPVGFLDFFASLGAFHHVDDLIDSALSQLVTLHGTTSPFHVSVLHRMVLQQAVIEWKLLTHEETLIPDLDEATYWMQDSVLAENPAAIDGLVRDLAAPGSVDPAGKRADAPDRDDSGPLAPELDSETGKLSPVDAAKYLAVYMNALEMVQLRAGLLDALFETEVLSSVYRMQARIANADTRSVLLDPIRFEDGARGGAGGTSGAKAPEVTSFSRSPQGTLAISEFEAAMAKFEFNTYQGVKLLCSEAGLVSLRQALQVQVLQRSVLTIAVGFNQLPLDAFIKRFDSVNFTFVTAPADDAGADARELLSLGDQASRDEQLKRERHDALVRLGQRFLDVTQTKQAIRKIVLHAYTEKSIRIMKISTPDTLAQKLRDLKFDLISGYCEDVITSLQPFALRTRIVADLRELRAVAERLSSDEAPFVLGSDDPAPGATGSSSADATDGGLNENMLVSDEGRLVNPWYLPSESEALSLMSTAKPGTQVTGLRFCLRMLAYMLDIVNLVRVQSKIALSATEAMQPWSGVEHLPLELSKIRNEIANLPDPQHAAEVTAYLGRRRQFFYFKFVLMLPNLADAFLSRDREQCVPLVQFELDRLVKPPQQQNVNMALLNPALLRVDARANDYFDAVQAVGTAGLYLGAPGPRLGEELVSTFLIRFSDADRNYANGEMMAIELLLEDLLVEKSVYSSSQPREAMQLYETFLQTSISLRQVRTQYLLGCLESDQEPRSTEAFRKFAKVYADNILSQVATRIQRADPDGEEHEDDENTPRSELLHRQIQLELLTNALDRLLLNDQLQAINEIFTSLMAELDHQVADPDGRTEAWKSYETKSGFLSDFVKHLLEHADSTQTASGDRGFLVAESNLQACLQLMSQQLFAWGGEWLSNETASKDAQIVHLTRTVKSQQQKMQHLEWMLEQDRLAVHRRIQAEVADKGYDLIFEIESLTRRNAELEHQMEEQSGRIRDEIRGEYEDVVKELNLQLARAQGQFQEYRNGVKADMLANVHDAKKEAFKRIVDSNATPMELKRRTLKLARSEEETFQLQEQISDLQRTVIKLKAFHKMRDIGLRSMFLKRIRRLEAEKSASNKSLWDAREEIEHRENVLRQQLRASQRSLGNAELEVETLRREVELQQRNKAALVQWKVSKTHQLAEMETKLQQFERWKGINVDKLLQDLEQRDSEIGKLTAAETRRKTKSEVSVQRAQKEIHKLRQELTKEKRLKQDAFAKLETIRQARQGFMDDASIKSGGLSARVTYAELNDQLTMVIQENETLRDELESVGVALPPPTGPLPRGRTAPAGMSRRPPSSTFGGSNGFKPRRPTTAPRIRRPASAPTSNVVSTTTVPILDLREGVVSATPTGGRADGAWSGGSSSRASSVSSLPMAAGSYRSAR